MNLSTLDSVYIIYSMNKIGFVSNSRLRSRTSLISNITGTIEKKNDYIILLFYFCLDKH